MSSSRRRCCSACHTMFHLNHGRSPWWNPKFHAIRDRIGYYPNQCDHAIRCASRVPTRFVVHPMDLCPSHGLLQTIASVSSHSHAIPENRVPGLVRLLPAVH